MARHNELRDRVTDLAGKEFTPSHVRDDPIIFAGCAIPRPEAKPARTTGTTDRDNAPLPKSTEQKGDLLIRDLWHNRTDSVHKMRVVDIDAKSHSAKPPEKFLQEAERAKKRMYRKRINFSPSIASVYGLLSVEAKGTLKRIASCLAINWLQHYSRTCGYVKSRIAINLMRATNHCILGSRVPAHHISVQSLQWEDGAGINIFR